MRFAYNVAYILIEDREFFDVLPWADRQEQETVLILRRVVVHSFRAVLQRCRDVLDLVHQVCQQARYAPVVMRLYEIGLREMLGCKMYIHVETLEKCHNRLSTKWYTVCWVYGSFLDSECDGRVNPSRFAIHIPFDFDLNVVRPVVSVCIPVCLWRFFLSGHRASRIVSSWGTRRKRLVSSRRQGNTWELRPNRIVQLPSEALHVSTWFLIMSTERWGWSVTSVKLLNPPRDRGFGLARIGSPPWLGTGRSWYTCEGFDTHQRSRPLALGRYRPSAHSREAAASGATAR